jgi:hypothetical protein
LGQFVNAARVVVGHEKVGHLSWPLPR